MAVDRGKQRVVALLDMDCFYVQVEQKAAPELRGKPCAVVQYKTWQGGGIIAVSYEARAYGVTRGMRGAEATKRCPGLLLARIPEAHGKANLSKYRQASREVVEVMSRFAVVERASIDEVFADLTDQAQRLLRRPQGLQRAEAAAQLSTTFVEGFPRDRPAPRGQGAGTLREEIRQAGLQAWLDSVPWDLGHDSPELLLTAGALIVEQMRAAVEAQTGYRCSAGISHNKVLAKLSCGMNKPNGQTLLPLDSVDRLFDTLPIGKIRNLGGKLGESISRLLKVEYVGQLRAVPEAQLQARFGEKTGSWLFDLCRGRDFEPVRPRHLPKSIGCSKNFLGREALNSCEQVEHWLLQLSTELQERLLQDRQQNGRVAGQLAVGVRLQGGSRNSSFQRCGPLSGQDAPRIARDALQLIKVFNTAGAQGGAWSPAVLALCLSARNFSPSAAASTSGITHFLSSPHPQRLPQAQSSGAGGTGSPRGAARHRAGTIASFFLQTPPRPETHPDPDPCPSPPWPVTHPDPCPEPLPSPPRPVACPDTWPVTCPEPCPEPLPSPPRPATCPDPCPSPSPSRVNGNIDRVMPAAVDLPSLSFFKCKALDCSPVVTSPSQPPPQPPACSLPPEVLVRCGRCGQSSLPWEVAEHEDFHFALDLQRSLSASLPPSSPSAPSVPRSPSNPSPPRVPSSPSAPHPPSSPSAPRPPSPPRVPSSPSAPRAPSSPSAPRPKKKAAAQLGGAGKRVCSSGRTLEWYFRKAPP